MKNCNHHKKTYDGYKTYEDGWSINEVLLVFIMIGVIKMAIADGLFFALILLWVEILMFVGVSGVAIVALRALFSKIFKKN